MAHAPARQRLAAILSADAAGYSRLMSRDEQSTIASLQAAREVFRHAIDGRNGRVVDTAGDSVLAIFETAIGAVSAALDVQAAMDGAAIGMPFRIGVHLADVFELPDGSVYGDGVNVAARLQAIADPGSVALSDVARSAIKGKLAVAVQDAGEHRVKNIPEPLRVFKVVSGKRPTASVQELRGDALPSREPSGHLTLPDKPSIAVLPLTNMSADPEQEYFCDGISEDIITELSRFRSLVVIARNSSFTYKGRAIDVRSVGKELGVHYVLEGGGRRVGGRIRLTAQLIDALTGAHLWAEKYDREVMQIFDIQEELTQRVVVSIAPSIEEAERERVRRQPEHLGAYEISVRAVAKASEAFRTYDTSKLDEALTDATAALSMDANSINALVARAFCRWQQVAFGTTSTPTQSWEDGINAATSAISIDRNDCRGYLQKAMLLAFAPQADSNNGALANARRAYELNPNDTSALQILAFVEALAGDTRSALEHLNQQLRMSPRDPFRYGIYNQFAMTWFLAGRYSEGADCAAAGIEEAPRHGTLHGWLALNCVGLGELSKAPSSLRGSPKACTEVGRACAIRWPGTARQGASQPSHVVHANRGGFGELTRVGAHAPICPRAI